MRSIICLEINQPLGTYYVSKLTIEEVGRVYTINRREGDNGIQRALDIPRKKGITEYCNDPDAIFPTPIIFSIKSDDIDKFEKEKDICRFSIKDNVKLSVVDGQHRIAGILESQLSKEYELPVVFMFDITVEEEAYIFSTINFNQKKVDKSLIYDLFGVYQTRSPKKTCHEIAKALNDESNSPFYKRLKVLGKKESSMETLSQGTFVYHLLPLICPEKEADSIATKIKLNQKPQEYPDCIFNRYFMREEDSTIYAILLNYFNAAREVFPEEWNSTSSILTKSTGYGGMMMALKNIFPICQEKRDASVAFFVKVFTAFKDMLYKENVKLTSDYFGSGQQEQKKLATRIEASVKMI